MALVKELPSAIYFMKSSDINYFLGSFAGVSFESLTVIFGYSLHLPINDTKKL